MSVDRQIIDVRKLSSQTEDNVVSKIERGKEPIVGTFGFSDSFDFSKELFLTDVVEEDPDLSSAFHLSRDHEVEEQAAKFYEHKGGDIRVAIAQGVVYDGNLVFDAPVRLDGKVSGKIQSSELVVIGELAEITAEIEAPVIFVHGSLEGEIHASECLLIQPGGYVSAQVLSPSLEVEEGGLFEGKAQFEAA